MKNKIAENVTAFLYLLTVQFLGRAKDWCINQPRLGMPEGQPKQESRHYTAAFLFYVIL